VEIVDEYVCSNDECAVTDDVADTGVSEDESEGAAKPLYFLIDM
jgi:hypothetical protein